MPCDQSDTFPVWGLCGAGSLCAVQWVRSSLGASQGWDPARGEVCYVSSLGVQCWSVRGELLAVKRAVERNGGAVN